MFLRDPPRTQAVKEVKICLSSRHLRALNAMRASTGRDRVDILTDALERYFAQLAVSRAQA